ncbi:MAG: ATP-binding protein [Noviherbaspirillum sp.]
METILSAQGRQQAFPIGEPSAIAAARRAACDLARELGFGETVTGRVAIVLTEAGTNILKYANRGEILLRKAYRFDGAAGIEILAIDAGPGMTHLTGSMKDGVSTAGSYGIGLGTMQRLADQFDIHTDPDRGTVICLCFWGAPDAALAMWCDVGVVCLPIATETRCGDAWAVGCDSQAMTLLLADGLGHGPLAAAASEAAAMLLTGDAGGSPARLLQNANQALQGARGAAVSVVRVDRQAGKLTFAGLGNVAACVRHRGQTQHLVPQDGIVGSAMRRLQEFSAPWSDAMLLVMYTDGLRSRWDFSDYPGLELLCPALVAAVLYRDCRRGSDDVTVLVCREQRGERLKVR